MSEQGPPAMDSARQQFESRRAPTVIVPIERDGEGGVFYASYEGDADWMRRASAEENQGEVAIACCKLAYADALRLGAHPRTVKRVEG